MRTLSFIALVSFLVCLNAMPAEGKRRKKVKPEPTPVVEVQPELNAATLMAYAKTVKVEQIITPLPAVPVIDVERFPLRVIPLVVKTEASLSTKLGIGLVLATIIACILWVMSTVREPSYDASVEHQRQHQQSSYSSPKDPRSHRDIRGKGSSGDDGGGVEQPPRDQGTPAFLRRSAPSRGRGFHSGTMGTYRPDLEPIELYRQQLRADPDTA